VLCGMKNLDERLLENDMIIECKLICIKISIKVDYKFEGARFLVGTRP